MSGPVTPDGSGDNRLNRRDFIRRAAVGAAALSGAGILTSAEAGRAAASPTASAASAAPKRGGALRVGMTGGSSADTLNPLKINAATDVARQSQLYDSLAFLDSNARPQLMLAEEMTPNANATEWTIRLRSGVEFHNGKSLTADDVIYSIQQLANPKNATGAESILAPVDTANIKKLDALTCRVPMKQPYATFIDSWATRNFFNVFPVGFNPAHPIGTGPFMFKSFTPGTQSEFVRNPHYWQHGLPYLDSLIITDFSDETSQVNALASGQVDAINDLTAVSIPSVESSGNYVIVENGGAWNPFFVRCDVHPFSDVRVRTALKLVVNRPQMLELVFGQHGLVGNDMFGIFDAAYDHSIPQRHQDIEQAKFLLKKAGQESLTFDLVIADIAQGVTTSAQVFAQQASQAGVKINIRQVTEAELFGPNYLKWPASIDYWYYNPYFLQASTSSLPSSSYNETHFDNAQYASLYKQAQAQPNPAKRAEIGHEMDKIYYEQGGYIIPYFAPTIDGYAKRVKGIGTSKVGGSFNNFALKELWLD